MSPHFEKLLWLVDELGMRPTVFTNGTFPRPELVELFVRHRAVVNVSIDSGDRIIHDRFRGQVGAFDKSMKMLSMLATAGIESWVTCTLTGEEKAHADELAEKCVDLGVNRLRFVEVVGAGAARQRGLTFDEDSRNSVSGLLDRLRGRGVAFDEATYFDFRQHRGIIRSDRRYAPFGCGAGSLRARVTARGAVLACPFMEDEGVSIDGDELAPASILERSFMDIWQAGGSDYLDEFRAGSVEPSGACANCPERISWCRSGCRADAFDLARTFRESDPNCTFIGMPEVRSGVGTLGGC